MITQTEGYYIINGAAISLGPSNVVSYREDADVQSFETEEAMLEAHQAQYPEQYVEDEEL